MGVSGLTVIARYPDPIALELFRGRLASEGIESFLQNEHVATMFPMRNWSLQGRGVELAVRDKDLERAWALFQEIEGPNAELFRSAAMVCPECSSEDVRQPTNWESLPAVVSVLLIGILGWLIRPKRKCRECGHRW